MLLLAAVTAAPAAAGTACEEIGSGPTETCEAWEVRFDHQNADPAEPAGDFANAVALSPDGSTVFVTGRVRRSSVDMDVVTAAYDASTGTQRWTTVWGGPGYDFGMAIAVSPDGEAVYVGAPTELENQFSYDTIAYDAATGEERWRVSYPTGLSPIVVSLAVAPDGGVIVAHASNGGFATAALEPEDGGERWLARWDGGEGDDTPFSIAVGTTTDEDGLTRSTVYVTGRTEDAPFSSRWDAATLAYDAASGEQRWAATWGGSGDEQARDLAVTPDGRRLVIAGWAGGASEASGYDAAALAYNTDTGALAWSDRYDGPSSNIDQGFALALSPDGSLAFVAGQSYSVRTNLDPVGRLHDAQGLLLAYEVGTGGRAWTVRHDGGPGMVSSFGDVVVHPSGSRVYGAGVSRTAGVTAAYDARSGAAIWLVRHGGATGTVGAPTDMAAAPDGRRVFVVGDWIGSNWYDMVTMAYEA